MIKYDKIIFYRLVTIFFALIDHDLLAVILKKDVGSSCSVYCICAHDITKLMGRLMYECLSSC